MKMTAIETIERTLSITTEWDDKHDRFIADAKGLPGSPPIGEGKTEIEAKYDLLCRLMLHMETGSYPWKTFFQLIGLELLR
jgi:hypothetical protein